MLRTGLGETGDSGRRGESTTVALSSGTLLPGRGLELADEVLELRRPRRR